MAWIAGVDGCKGGWIAVYEDTDSGKLDCRVKETFEKVMAHPDLSTVAVDMPIGLCDEKEGRACDKAARDVLGERSRSIFPAPTAGVVDLYSRMTVEKRREQAAYELAKRENKKLTGSGREKDGKGLTKQTWALVPKIAEVASYLEGSPGSPVYEVHPEVCFAAMKSLEKGGDPPPFSPMRFSKATAAGLLERRALLNSNKAFGNGLEILERTVAEADPDGRAALDDFYDALACLWTARRIQKEPDGPARALCGVDGVRKLSDSAPKDANGLPMRIVY